MTTFNDPDKATDWIAIGLSTLVAVTLWGLFLYEYTMIQPYGEANQYLMGAAGIFTLLAAVTLFGYEKVKNVMDLKS